MKYPLGIKFFHYKIATDSSDIIVNQTRQSYNCDKMAHAQISVEPFGGSDNEDFAQFEQLFQGYVGVAGIANAQQANFLQLHLRDNALRFYQTLPALTRADVPLSLVALCDHFCNPQLQEVHVLKLEQSKFDIKRDSPENFLVNLTKKAQRAYPTPDLPVVAPLDGALVGRRGSRCRRSAFPWRDGATSRTT